MKVVDLCFQIRILLYSQVVSCRLSTAAALVRNLVRSCGIYGGQNDIEAGFLRVLRFSLPIIPPTDHIHRHLSPGVGTIGQIAADVPSGLRRLWNCNYIWLTADAV
jgi:hypothetical protein